jgi:hypothetical protein
VALRPGIAIRVHTWHDIIGHFGDIVAKIFSVNFSDPSDALPTRDGRNLPIASQPNKSSSCHICLNLHGSGHCLFQPFHRRRAPIGGMPFLKDITRMVFAKCECHPKKGNSFSKWLGSAEHPFLIYIVQIRIILLKRKDAIFNLLPNRDASKHVLIVTIDVDFREERMIRRDFSLTFKNLKALDLPLYCMYHVNQNLKLSRLTNSLLGCCGIIKT